MSRPRVLLADDHAVVLEAFAALLAPRCDVVGMVTDGHALVERAQALRPDVMLVDVAMPRLNGLDACERVRQVVPGAKLIFLTMSQDRDTAREALRRGASGYVLKSSGAAELFEAIGTALRGGVYVSPALVDEPVGVFVSSATASRKEGLSLRQREVLQLLAEGKSSGDGLAVAIAEHRPDIVVLDVTLPGANGIELASRLRATAGCPKIVILTVHDDPDYLRAALEAGAAAYVVKARLLQDLVPALTAVRGGRQFVSASGGLADD